MKLLCLRSITTSFRKGMTAKEFPRSVSQLWEGEQFNTCLSLLSLTFSISLAPFHLFISFLYSVSYAFGSFPFIVYFLFPSRFYLSFLKLRRLFYLSFLSLSTISVYHWLFDNCFVPSAIHFSGTNSCATLGVSSSRSLWSSSLPTVRIPKITVSLKDPEAGFKFLLLLSLLSELRSGANLSSSSAP